MNKHGKFSEWVHNIQIRYYRHLIKNMSPFQKLRWADEHPDAKKALGIRGLSDLSILEKSCIPIRNDDH